MQNDFGLQDSAIWDTLLLVGSRMAELFWLAFCWIRVPAKMCGLTVDHQACFSGNLMFWDQVPHYCSIHLDRTRITKKWNIHGLASSLFRDVCLALSYFWPRHMTFCRNFGLFNPNNLILWLRVNTLSQEKNRVIFLIFEKGSLVAFWKCSHPKC